MPGPTTRVLAVLELLQSKRRVTGAELAERLDVDRRTIRRYITVLEDMGVPVTTEQGRHGCYMLVPGFKLPPMMFTDEETLAISLGLLAARQLGMTKATPALESVQAKLERVMPDNLKRRVRGINETTKLVSPTPKPPLDGDLLLKLTRAIQAEQRVHFIYRPPDKDATQREADPYGLAFRTGHWYMSGYCHLRQAMRSFRLDRMAQVEPLPVHFQRPPEFDAAEHLMQSIRNLPRDHKVSVLLHTDAETAAKALGFFPDIVGAFQHRPDGLLLDTHTDCIEWFASWLTRLPFPFRVEGPPELKKTLRRHAEKLLCAC